MTEKDASDAKEIQGLGSTTSNEQYTRVNVGKCREDTLLTEAFHNPRLFREQRTYALDNNQFAVDAPGQTWYGQEVVLLRRIYNKKRIVWLLMFMLLSAPMVGTATAMACQSAEVGVAVTATGVTLAAFALALLVWLGV